MIALTSGKLDIHAVALDPIHHGGGTSGNTQVVRTQEVILADGTVGRVPYISGNSIKHMIRDGAARYALDAMAVEDGSLSKAVVDLLFSGGQLTKSGGAVRIDKARRLAEVFPALSLCGYSAGNMMTQSKVRVDHMHLVCAENRWRVPPQLVEHPLLERPGGAFRGDAFGTRHDAIGLPAARRVLALEDAAGADNGAVKRSRGDRAKLDTTQMIYEMEVVLPGSHWFGALHFVDLTEGELMALRTGLSYPCEGRHADGGYVYRLGGKGAVGYGRVSMAFAGTLREPVRPQDHTPSDVALPVVAADAGNDSRLAAYTQELHEHRGEILDLLAGMA